MKSLFRFFKIIISISLVAAFAYAQTSTCTQAKAAQDKSKEDIDNSRMAIYYSAAAAAYGCVFAATGGAPWCYGGLAGIAIFGYTLQQAVDAYNSGNRADSIIRVHCDMPPSPDIPRNGGTPSNPDPVGDAVATLNKVGVKYDPKAGTFKLPDGKTLTKKGILDGSQVPAGSQQGISDMLASIQKQAKEKVAEEKKNTDVNGEVISGGGAPVAPAIPPPPDFNALLNQKADGGSKGARGPAANAKGLSRLYNGEPIGVAGDSIFGMVNRRYNSQAEAKTLIAP